MNTNYTNAHRLGLEEINANTCNVPAHRSALAHRCVFY